MALLRCIVGTVVLFTLLSWTEAGILRNSTDESTGSERPELVNNDSDGVGGSGVFRRIRRNADPCIRSGCKWPMYSDWRVYVPYVLDSRYSPEAQRFIQCAMETISQTTCVRFFPRTFEFDYLNIQDLQRCSSAVGRRGGAQTVELNFPRCFTTRTIQHVLMRALGFHPEQNRSDRDQHITVNWQNINSLGNIGNFLRVDTENLGTPYDYNSVMHYPRLAFSGNGQSTLEAKPFLREFGTATQMSQTDITRVRRLYCPNWNWP